MAQKTILQDPKTTRESHFSQVDVNFAEAFKRSKDVRWESNAAIQNFAANKAKGRNLPITSVEISPQEQAGAALTSQPAIPSDYTENDFAEDIVRLTVEVYGSESLNFLANTNKNAYNKFMYQKIYDVIDNNQNLYTYFEEYYPDYLQKVKNKASEYGVVVGQTSYGQDILASPQGTFMDVPASVKYFSGKPFDDASVRAAEVAKGFTTGVARMVYGLGVAAGGVVDVFASPRQRGIELLSSLGVFTKASPQKIAEWRNDWFKNDDTVTPFTPEEIEKMTFQRLSQDPSAVTFSDRVISEIAKRAPGFGLGVVPEEMSTDSMLTAPGGVPLGEGQNALIDGIVNTASLTLGGRLGVEAAKSTMRRVSPFYVRGVGYDYVSARRAIEQQMALSGGVGKMYGRARIGSLNASLDLGYTIASEQTIALSSFLAAQQYGKLGYFEDDPTKQALSTLAVGLLGGVVGLTAARSGVNLTYNFTERFMPALFSGDYADLQEVLGKQNTPYGRRIVRTMGKVLETIKRDDPDNYDAILSTFRQFKSDAEATRTALVESGVSEVEADELVKLMIEGKSNAWAASLFGGAREYTTQFTLAGKSFMKSTSFRDNVEENMRKLASLKRAEAEEELAVQAFGRSFFELSKKFRALEDSGIGAPQELRTLVLNMRDSYYDTLNVPKEKAKKIGNALENVYNIADRYNAKTDTKDQALEKINILYASMDDQEKDIFTRVLRDHLDTPENYGGFTKSLENLEIVQEQIEADRTLARSVHAPLQNAGIIGPLGELNVEKPDKKRMRTPQTLLLRNAFDTNKRTADKLYDEAFEEATDLKQTVSFAKFGLDLKNKILGEVDDGTTTAGQKPLGLDYGIEGLKEARRQLADIKSSSKFFNKFFDILSKDDDADVSLEEVIDIIENTQDLSLKEAVQLRSDIASRAFKLRDTNRKASAVLSDIHSILDARINSSFPETGVVGAKLKLANDNYRDNVAMLFFDRYTRTALKGQIDMPNPFDYVFNKSTIRMSADGNVEGGNSPVLRRDIYERMFPEGSPLREEADQQIKDTMNLQIFGKISAGEMSQAEYVRRLRRISEDNSLFGDKEDGGFLDILLKGSDPDNVTNFRILSKKAPYIEDNGALSPGGRRDILRINTAELLAGDPFYIPHDMTANKEYIGSVVEKLQKTFTQNTEKIEFSVTSEIFADIKGLELADAGAALVRKILNTSGKSAKNTYLSILEDVYKFYGDDSPEAIRFESAINKVITEDLINKVSDRFADVKNLDEPDIKAVRFNDFEEELGKNKELYAQIFGDDYESVLSFVRMGALSDTINYSFKIDEGVKAMSDNMALSRLWGSARGVVSYRYSAAEYLLRQFSSKNNKALIEVLSTPHLANYVLDAVENNVYRPFVSTSMARRVIPALAGVLSEQNNTEDYKTTLTALHEMYKESNVRGTDFTANIVSLILAARNEPLRNELLEILKRQKTEPTLEERLKGMRPDRVDPADIRELNQIRRQMQGALRQ